MFEMQTEDDLVSEKGKMTNCLRAYRREGSSGRNWDTVLLKMKGVLPLGLWLSAILSELRGPVCGCV